MAYVKVPAVHQRVQRFLLILFNAAHNQKRHQRVVYLLGLLRRLQAKDRVPVRPREEELVHHRKLVRVLHGVLARKVDLQVLQVPVRAQVLKHHGVEQADEVHESPAELLALTLRELRAAVEVESADLDDGLNELPAHRLQVVPSLIVPGVRRAVPEHDGEAHDIGEGLVGVGVPPSVHVAHPFNVGTIAQGQVQDHSLQGCNKSRQDGPDPRRPVDSDEQRVRRGETLPIRDHLRREPERVAQASPPSPSSAPGVAFEHPRSPPSTRPTPSPTLGCATPRPAGALSGLPAPLPLKIRLWHEITDE